MEMNDIRHAIVLSVEDNKDNYFVNQLTLRSIGIRPERHKSWSSGPLMLKWLESNPDVIPTLILVDLQLPHMNGYEVLQALQTMPRLKDTMIVAVTANVMNTDIERCRTEGFHGFIGKPITPERFPNQLLRLLNGETVWEPY